MRNLIAWNRRLTLNGVRLLFVTLQVTLPVACASSLANNGPATAAPTAPAELGLVNWRRDFDAAVAEAKVDRKPLLVLFQEVPGCGTCVAYGRNVLSHPLIVEAAETLFVPVAVFNNVDGPDRVTLESFQEKAQSNPVVRIMQPDRTELAPRVTENDSAAGLANAMVRAQTKVGGAVPNYLQLLVVEMQGRSRGLEQSTFAMHCFWEGEAALGDIPGVISTQSGYVGEDEVVDVFFDPGAIAFNNLLRQAAQLKCATKVFTRSDAQHQAASAAIGEKALRSREPTRSDEKEPKYHIGKTSLRFVPMTTLQACRINAALSQKRDPSIFLSPRQLDLHKVIEAHPEAGWSNCIDTPDWTAAWVAATRTALKFGGK